MKAICIAVVLALSATSAGAQWLKHPTPGLPRNADGKVNLSAPAPRTADGKPDFTGIWASAGGQENLGGLATLRVDPADMKPWARDLQRERGHDYFKGRPEFMCRPSGVEAEHLEREKRILQTPAMIAVLNANQTYRQIFLDGRQLEKDPAPMWQGFSVGRWEGDTLVVESNGFNDKTWLNNVGLPHTEKLRVTERYTRPSLGRMNVDVTYDDPDAYHKPLKVSLRMRLVTDTEMLEEVCEADTNFAGRPQKAGVMENWSLQVAPIGCSREIDTAPGALGGFAVSPPLNPGATRICTDAATPAKLDPCF